MIVILKKELYLILPKKAWILSKGLFWEYLYWRVILLGFILWNSEYHLHAETSSTTRTRLEFLGQK